MTSFRDFSLTPVLTVVPGFCTVDSLVIECEDEAQVKQVLRLEWRRCSSYQQEKNSDNRFNC